MACCLTLTAYWLTDELQRRTASTDEAVPGVAEAVPGVGMWPNV